MYFFIAQQPPVIKIGNIFATTHDTSIFSRCWIPTATPFFKYLEALSILTLYRHSQYLRYTSTLNTYTIQALSIPTLYRHSQCLHYTGTLNTCTIQALSMPTLYRHSQCLHYTGTLSTYTIQALSIPTLYRHSQYLHYIGSTYQSFTQPILIVWWGLPAKKD
jgi:hypothetical protein